MKEIIICAVIIVVLIVGAIVCFLYEREEVNEFAIGPITYTDRPYQGFAIVLIIFAIAILIAIPILYQEEKEKQSNILVLQEEIDSLNVLLNNEEDQTDREVIAELITKKEKELVEYEK